MRPYVHTPKHPDVVTGLQDREVLSRLAARVDQLTTEPRTHTAQQALIEAHAVLVAAVKTLTP